MAESAVSTRMPPDPLMRRIRIRILYNLVNELAKGKAMDRILRQS